ncbi:flagellar protein FliT [Metabacillus halosaccharovorans]|uniref:flagellar protein FliT n=1 Tax=Bacillaceae TaxID=186817 RepID=UPI0004BB2944|nr:flagellar protein FliT [Bacillus sp. J37]
MSIIKRVYSLTKELYTLTKNPSDKEKRDEVIDKLTSLLDEREELIQEIKPPYLKEDEPYIKGILGMNKQIDKQLISIQKQVQFDRAQLKKTKESTNHYINPYQHTSTDGMFYDKRK